MTYNDRMTVCCRPTGRDAPALIGSFGPAQVARRTFALVEAADPRGVSTAVLHLPQGFDYVVILNARRS